MSTEVGEVEESKMYIQAPERGGWIDFKIKNVGDRNSQ